MSPISQFIKLTKANIKRLSKYTVSMIISVILLLIFCISAGMLISKNLYKEKAFENISIGYYIPEGDSYYSYALGMVNNLEGFANTISLKQVSDIEKGYKMVENGDIMYLLVAPENFFTGIIDGTNPPLEIVVKDNSSIGSYIINELFISYAKYLGIAQSAVYSTLDTLRNANEDTELISTLQDKVNTINLARVVNKELYIEEITATNENSYSLDEHYMASATMLVLFLISIVFLPVMQNYTNGMKTRLSLSNVSFGLRYISHVITCMVALYATFIISYFSISVYNKKININGMLYGLLPVLAISLIIALIGTITKDNFSGNLTILLAAILITYIGGGLIPNAMLPGIIQKISDFFPGKYILSGIANALFGGNYAT